MLPTGEARNMLLGKAGGDIIVATHGVDRESGSTSMIRVLYVPGD